MNPTTLPAASVLAWPTAPPKLRSPTDASTAFGFPAAETCTVYPTPQSRIDQAGRSSFCALEATLEPNWVRAANSSGVSGEGWIATRSMVAGSSAVVVQVIVSGRPGLMKSPGLGEVIVRAEVNVRRARKGSVRAMLTLGSRRYGRG
jgi:hypothetical protein